MFEFIVPFSTGDEGSSKTTVSMGGVGMNNFWFSFDEGYSHNADYADNTMVHPFRPSELRQMTSIQRYLHSGEPLAIPDDGRLWTSKHTIEQGYEHWQGWNPWQRPTEYPTPPWDSQSEERCARDRDSISNCSIWSPHMSETEREGSFARRPSPTSDVSRYEPCRDMGYVPSFLGSAPCGGSATSECIAPSAIQQYPDPAADVASNPDADADGDSDDFPVDPTLQGTSNPSQNNYSHGYEPIKPASLLPIPRSEGDGSSIQGTSAHPPRIEDDDAEIDGDFKDDDSSDYKPSKRPKSNTNRRTSRVCKPRPLSHPYSIRRSYSTPSKPVKMIKQPNRNSALRRGALVSNPQSNQKSCSFCAHICPSMTALNKHVLTAHTRPFICAFARYGCPATFGSKNEYKRHVSSQHLRPGIYRCDIGSCVPQPRPQRRKSSSASFSKETASEGYNEFNRKDLFTQHVRRMHGPSSSAPKSEKDLFETGLEQIRTRCWVKLHDPPPRSVCGFCLHASDGKSGDRPVVFEGKSGWEERMEHVGRHLEKGERNEDEDVGLRDWMVQEGLMDWSPAEGRWKVVGTGKKRAEDEDAEGESE